MDQNTNNNSYHDIKSQNVLENRYLTISLSDELLADPMRLRCMFCGESLNAALHRVPLAVTDAMVKAADCDPLVDVRCKRCKLNYRFTY